MPLARPRPNMPPPPGGGGGVVSGLWAPEAISSFLLIWGFIGLGDRGRPNAANAVTLASLLPPRSSDSPEAAPNAANPAAALGGPPEHFRRPPNRR